MGCCGKKPARGQTPIGFLEAAWETDFTTMAPLDMLANGAYVLTPNVEGDALPWTAGNGAALTERAIIAGVGLRMTTTAVGQSFGGTTRQVGYLQLPLDSLGSQFDFTRARVRVMAVITGATTAIPNTSAGMLVGMWTSEVNGLAWFVGKNLTNTAVQGMCARALYTSADLGLPAFTPLVDTAVMVQGTKSEAVMSHYAYAGAWPDANGWDPRWSYVQNQNYYNPFAAGLRDMQAVVNVGNGGSAAIAQAVCQRLRIEVYQ